MAVGRCLFLTMDKLTLLAPAKLNLLLDITGKRPDGYHEVRMIMQTVSWFDRLTLEKTGRSGISFRVTGPEGQALSMEESGIPLDERNLVLKAVRLLSDDAASFEGLRITLEKNIPSQAGLGGGSSDAAAALLGIDRLYELGHSREELAEKALKLGADVPFFLQCGTCLAEGVGEKLTKLPSLRLSHILIAKPKASLSTKLVYEYCDSLPQPVHPDIEGFLRALSEKEARSDTFLTSICETMGNVMEAAAFVLCPEVRDLRDRLLGLGAETALMTGSGSAVFGIFRDGGTARNALEILHKNAPDLILKLTETHDFGVEENPV